MPDATELAVLSSALPATLAFLYQRLERLLDTRSPAAEPAPQMPDALVGTLQLPLQADQDRLHERRQELTMLHDGLSSYIGGRTPVDAEDDALLRMAGRLRGVLEDVYGQRLTFAGEQRPTSGPFVHQKISEVSGTATGMEADEYIGQGSGVIQELGTVTKDGNVIGMRAPRIGTPPSSS